MERIWSNEETELLRRLCSENKSLKQILKALPTKSESQVRTKCKNLKISFNKKRKKWKPDEIERFKADWSNHSISNSRLRGKYRNRTLTALRACARRLNLAERPYDDSYLRIRDIVEEMHVSKDRVRSWLKKGLKWHKSHIKPVTYLIDADDLLEFLKENPDLYDASQISRYLFYKEPDWLRAKRKIDEQNYLEKAKSAQYYENDECKEIEKLFKLGFSNEQIAERLNRTAYGIERMLGILNLSRKHYNDYELDIIKEYHDKITIDELVAMLPLRTKSGVIGKCEQLKLKYKTVRKPRKKKAVTEIKPEKIETISEAAAP